MKIAASALLLFIIMVSARLIFAAPPPPPNTVVAPPSTVRLSMSKNNFGVEGVVLQFYIKGEVDDVWKIVTNSQLVPVLFKSVKSVVHVKKEESGQEKVDKNLWTYQLDSPIGVNTLQVVTEDDHNNHIAKWKRISGDLNFFGGEWNLKPAKKYKGYTFVIYKNFIDGGTFAPQFITNKLNREDATEMVPRLKEQLLKINKSEKN